MPIPFLLILFGIIFAVSKAAKKEAEARKRAANTKSDEPASPWDRAPGAQRTQSRQNSPAQSARPAQSSGAEGSMSAQQRQAELKRRLEENARRREMEKRAAASSPARPAAPAKPTAERRPLEKTPMAPVREKPVAVHELDDCGGGSIHDGYHEGVTQFGQNRPAAVAGRLGRDLAEEDDRAVKEAASAENARRAMARIAKLPPLAQGMIYSEILGKPRSETA